MTSEPMPRRPGAHRLEPPASRATTGVRSGLIGALPPAAGTTAALGHFVVYATEPGQADKATAQWLNLGAYPDGSAQRGGPP